MVKSKAEKPLKAPKEPKEPMSPEKKKKLYIGGGVFAFLILVWIAMTPMQGSTFYGICKVYVELSELYPREIKYLSVEDWDPVKIYYRKVDPFGVESVNLIECHFKRDTAGNLLYEIAKIDINGKSRSYEAEKPEVVDQFNKGIVSILENLPDLALPSFSQDNIANYKDVE
jgi:hypothetical protein